MQTYIQLTNETSQPLPKKKQLGLIDEKESMAFLKANEEKILKAHEKKWQKKFLIDNVKDALPVTILAFPNTISGYYNYPKLLQLIFSMSTGGNIATGVIGSVVNFVINFYSYRSCGPHLRTQSNILESLVHLQTHSLFVEQTIRSIAGESKGNPSYRHLRQLKTEVNNQSEQLTKIAQDNKINFPEKNDVMYCDFGYDDRYLEKQNKCCPNCYNFVYNSLAILSGILTAYYGGTSFNVLFNVTNVLLKLLSIFVCAIIGVLTPLIFYQRCSYFPSAYSVAAVDLSYNSTIALLNKYVLAVSSDEHLVIEVNKMIDKNELLLNQISSSPSMQDSKHDHKINSDQSSTSPRGIAELDEKLASTDAITTYRTNLETRLNNTDLTDSKTSSRQQPLYKVIAGFSLNTLLTLLQTGISILSAQLGFATLGCIMLAVVGVTMIYRLLQFKQLDTIISIFHKEAHTISQIMTDWNIQIAQNRTTLNEVHRKAKSNLNKLTFLNSIQTPPLSLENNTSHNLSISIKSS